MKGKNSIVLNQATLCDVVELWMNEHNYAGEEVKVTGASFQTTDSTATFTIEPAKEAI